MSGSGWPNPSFPPQAGAGTDPSNTRLFASPSSTSSSVFGAFTSQSASTSAAHGLPSSSSSLHQTVVRNFVGNDGGVSSSSGTKVTSVFKGFSGSHADLSNQAATGINDGNQKPSIFGTFGRGNSSVFGSPRKFVSETEKGGFLQTPHPAASSVVGAIKSDQQLAPTRKLSIFDDASQLVATSSNSAPRSLFQVGDEKKDVWQIKNEPSGSEENGRRLFPPTFQVLSDDLKIPKKQFSNMKKRSFDESGPMQNPQISSSVDNSGATSKKRSVHGVQMLRSMLTSTKKHISPQRSSDKTVAEHSKVMRAPALQPAGMRSRRISSSSALAEQAASLVSSSIICLDVPPEIKDKLALRRHFSRFGDISRVLINEDKNTATVTFKTHDMAIHAKREGAYVDGSNSPMKIYFKKARKSSEKPHVQRDENTHSSKLQQPILQAKMPPTNYRGGMTRFPLRSSVPVIYARTDEEKLALLEKIDQLLRKQVVRQSDIKKAKTSKGTCPDMCPEKERYLRQQRKLLAFYEMDGGSVDHSKAIKEYSRSSADQDEPLTHELRPSNVLRMTMHYLLSTMMPKLSEGQTADWYDFIWNRTRAIRKELTIQQISDINAININEQCARFHIFCAHQLCGEDRMVFDPKINNENLEKTMKTVMDLYQEVYFTPDISRSVPILNSNVAELYSYYILLNINRTADVLNELQELPPELRTSPAIGIAIEAFMSVHSNNYTKFFKVTRRATFLQGCILHRYFAQVRRRAALTMAKALAAPGTKMGTFPVDDFIRILCFNDFAELQAFCQHLSIVINGNVLELNRNGFEEQDSTLPLSPSSLVLSKTDGENLAIHIANCPLELAQHKPYSSFDDDGRYVGEHLSLLSSQNSSDRFQALPSTKISAEEMPTSTAKMLPPGVTNNLVKYIAKDLFHEVIDEISLPVAKDFWEATLSACILKGIFDEVVVNQCDSIARETMDYVIEQKRKDEEMKTILEERKRKELLEREAKRQKELEEKKARERIKKEKEEMKLRQSKVVADEILLIVENEIIKSVAEIEHGEFTRKHKIEKWSKEEMEYVLDKVLASMTKDICNTTWKELKKITCSKLYGEFRLWQLERAFKKWKRVKMSKLKFQNLTNSFPNMPVQRSLADQVRVFLPNLKGSTLSRKRTSFPLDISTELSLQSPMEMVIASKRTKALVNDATVKFDELYTNASLPLSFCDMLKTASQKPDFFKLGMIMSDTIFWKIGLWLPEPHECTTLESWLQYAFVGDKSCCTHESADANIFVNCHVLSDENLKSDLKGVFSLVLTLPAPNLNRHGKWDFAFARAQLEKLMSARSAVPPIPLLIVLLDWIAEPDDVEEQLGLTLLNFTFSRWTMCCLKSGTGSILYNYQELVNGIEFLFCEVPSLPSLTSVTVREFFESTLAEEYVTPLYKHVSQRLEARMSPLEPNIQIQFFNFVIDALASAVCNDEFREISWPPSGFSISSDETHFVQQNWNSDEVLQSNFDSMQSCKVPFFNDSPVLETESGIMDAALEYALSVSPNSAALLSAVKNRVTLELQKLADDIPLVDETDFAIEDVLKRFNWHLVIDCVISQHLTDILYHSKIGDCILTFPSDCLSKIENQKGLALFGETGYQSLTETHAENKGSVTMYQSGIVEDMFSDLEYSLPKSSFCDTTWIESDTESSRVAKESQTLREALKEERELNEQHQIRLEALLRDGDLPLSLSDATAVCSSIMPSDLSILF